MLSKAITPATLIATLAAVGCTSAMPGSRALSTVPSPSAPAVQVERRAPGVPQIKVSPNPACIGQTVTFTGDQTSEASRRFTSGQVAVWMQPINGPTNPWGQSLALGNATISGNRWSFSFVLKPDMGLRLDGQPLNLAGDTVYGITAVDESMGMGLGLTVLADCPL